MYVIHDKVLLLNFIYKSSSEHGNNRFSKQNKQKQRPGSAEPVVHSSSQMSALGFKNRLSYKLLKNMSAAKKVTSDMTQE